MNRRKLARRTQLARKIKRRWELAHMVDTFMVGQFRSFFTQSRLFTRLTSKGLTAEDFEPSPIADVFELSSECDGC